jgi:CheY-like chemotaxis protein
MVTKGSVLVVDDEINLCRILGAKLAKSGYDVVAVHDGAQAVEKVRESDFDVVLLDLILPKMDGLTALAKIRGMRRTLPVIVMTACESADALEQARAHGVSAYVNKPFDLDSLVNLVACTSQARISGNDRKLPESTVLFGQGQPITVEIQNGHGARIYSSCICAKNDRTLSVEAPREEGGVLCVPPRTSVRVALAGRDAHYSFLSQVVDSTSDIEQVLVLDKPRVIYRAQRREHPRTELSVPLKYARMDDEEQVYRSGRTQDLSLGGACIVVPEEVLPGEMLQVEIRPKSTRDTLSLVAQVLRAKRRPASEDPDFILGCKFANPDERIKKLLGS